MWSNQNVFALSSGFDAFGGSSVNTSTAAPLIKPVFNAYAKSSSFTSGPLAVFIKNALFS